MAIIMTFRTEILFDNERVPALLELMGVVQIDRPSHLHSDDCTFTIQAPETCPIDYLRDEMKKAIECENSKFPDMHRCYQTLNEGFDTNEEWYFNTN